MVIFVFWGASTGLRKSTSTLIKAWIEFSTTRTLCVTVPLRAIADHPSIAVSNEETVFISFNPDDVTPLCNTEMGEGHVEEFLKQSSAAGFFISELPWSEIQQTRLPAQTSADYGRKVHMKKQAKLI